MIKSTATNTVAPVDSRVGRWTGGIGIADLLRPNGAVT
jgi:hypothetical protein